MATESPLRLIGGNGAGNWYLSKDAAVFSASASMTTGELGLLLEGQRFHGNRIITGPSRSGSAPPSMEGSRAAFDLLKSQQFFGVDGSLETLVNVANNCKDEEQFRSHPAYLSYYCANVNLNPRLPPPLISRENRDLVNHISGLDDRWEMQSFNDNNKGPLFVSRAPLSTHKEEPEDEKSPRAHSIEDNMNVDSQARVKSVNSLQEDYSSSSFPVYNDYSRPSGHDAAESADNLDSFSNPEHDSSVEKNKTDIRIPTSEFSDCNSNTDAQAAGIKSIVDAVSVPFSSSSDKIVALQSSLNLELSGMNLHNSDIHQSTITTSDLNMETEMKNLRISNDGYRNQHERHFPHQVGINSWGTLSQSQMNQSQMVPQGVYHPQNSSELFSHSHPKLSSTDVPIQQSSTITPSYAAATTNGTPYYSSLQPSSLFPLQFGIGGYALNTSMVPPVMSGYPPYHATLPVPIENPVNPSFAARSSGVSAAGSFIPGTGLQQFYKVYGQPVMPVLSSFYDQPYMPFFQHPFVGINTTGTQYEFMIPRGGIVGNPSLSYGLQKGTTSSVCLPDQRAPVPILESGSTLPSRKVNTLSPNHLGNSSNLGALMQYPNCPITSPLFQGSPTPNPSFSGRINGNMRYSHGSGRNSGSGWQGPRGHEQVDNPKYNSFLEELKVNKARRYEFSDIAGRIVEFSSDQHGSRFIQQKLESCSAEEKTSVFNEVLPHAPALMTDVFGNYVIQKFFEYGSLEQRKELANKLVGNILPLSLQMYGCRVIQKALEVIELGQKTKLVQELDGHVMRCVHDQNGNHVIQKCIECVPMEKIGFIISSFRGHVATLSMHPYGCRVIQRVLEHCTDESQSRCIVDEILQSACILAQDQYGNYVTQHVLERGRPNERNQIISKLAGKVVQLSQHKFASNVIEKCLVYGDASEKGQLMEEIIDQTEGNDSLLMMMKDQFANYVVQKILETCSDKQREILLGRIKVHLHALKKYTYGKHIAARVDQLCGEDDQSSGS